MITPDRARRLVEERCRSLGSTSVDIDESLGFVLAEDVRARSPLPPFDNSAMDGFAVCARSTRTATSSRPARFAVVGTVFAGGSMRRTIDAHSACGVMTGAPMPPGTDSVIPLEAATIEGDQLVVSDPVTTDAHVRRAGEERSKGALILRAGDIVHPGTVGCLASAGKRRVRVIRRPRVSVIATGDELVAPGKRLALGKIYDSNSHMMLAMLRGMGIDSVMVRRVKDRRAAISSVVCDAMSKSDVVVASGGVSVGEHDYLRSVLEEHRVREVFWRVRQKPGKPLYFGTKGRVLVFGLPGNPAAVFTCFHAYIYPALKRLSGLPSFRLRREVLRLGEAVRRDPVRWRLLKGNTDETNGARVVALPHQGSHMVTSLARTNCLIVVPPGNGEVAEGAEVSAYRLPLEEVHG